MAIPLDPFEKYVRALGNERHRMTPTETTQSLGDAFPKEQARVREVLGLYKGIGPAGVFGTAMIEDVLRRADRAAMSGDVVAMLAVYQEMKDIEA